jgi:hypothetical protein
MKIVPAHSFPSSKGDLSKVPPFENRDSSHMCKRRRGLDGAKEIACVDTINGHRTQQMSQRGGLRASSNVERRVELATEFAGQVCGGVADQEDLLAQEDFRIAISKPTMCGGRKK